MNYFRWICELFSEYQPPNYASVPLLQITPKAVRVKATYTINNPLHNRLIFKEIDSIGKSLSPDHFQPPVSCVGGGSLTSFALAAAAPIWAALQFPQGGENRGRPRGCNPPKMRPAAGFPEGGRPTSRNRRAEPAASESGKVPVNMMAMGYP